MHCYVQAFPSVDQLCATPQECRQSGRCLSIRATGNLVDAMTGTQDARYMELSKAAVASEANGQVTSEMTTDAARRKAAPMATGLLDYFPDALIDVARLSKIGNEQHNPGEPLHWARGKSMDQADCIMRHMVDRGKIDTDKVLHDTKVAWRSLAQLQLTIERMRAAGIAYP